jgi:hypothetical protein
MMMLSKKNFFNNIIYFIICILSTVVSAKAKTGTSTSTSPFRNDVHILMYETDSTLERDPSQPLYFFKERTKVANLKTTIFGGDLAYHGFGKNVGWQPVHHIFGVLFYR